MFARYKASSRATSPPPTTATVLFLKKAPSHVAQYETPAPVNSFSPFTPSTLCFAPVAIIMAFVFITSPFTNVISFISPLSSIDVTCPSTNGTFNSSACCLNLTDKS